MNGIITVYNNTIGLIPGVSKIDMLEFADNMEVADDAMKDTATQAGTTATAIEGTGTTAGTAAQAVKDAAADVLIAEQKLTDDWATERKERLQNALDQMAEEKIAATRRPQPRFRPCRIGRTLTRNSAMIKLIGRQGCMGASRMLNTR